MIGIAGLVVVAALGADYGWEPAADGQSLEYIIQISPELLQSLQEGDEIRRAVPPEAANVTCFRVKLGDGELPRHTVRQNPHIPMRATQVAGYDDPQHNPATSRPVLGRPNQHQPNYSHGPIGVDYTGPIGPPSPNYGGSSFGQSSTFGTSQQQQQPYHYDSSGSMYDQGHDPLFNRYTNQPNNQSNIFSVPPNPNNLLASAPRTGTAATPYRGVGTTPVSGFGNTTRYATDAEKPWWPLLATSIALFISLGGNCYLGWVAAEFYTRYRDTVERMRAERRY